jgi:hypothetical protein
LLLVLCVATCRQTPKEGPVEVAHGVILPPEAWPAYAFAVDGHWMPTKRQVRALEKRLPAYLREEALELRWPLERYFRQYAGIVIEGDRQVIYVNCVLDTEKPDDVDLTRELLVVQDGGDAFFEVFYDPEQEVLFDLYVHGEA